MHYLKSFLYFWWDFLVGDSPELAVAVLVLLVVALTTGMPGQAGTVLLPVVVAAGIVVSVYIGKMRIGH